jgi:hypothetical protein
MIAPEFNTGVICSVATFADRTWQGLGKAFSKPPKSETGQQTGESAKNKAMMLVILDLQRAKCLKFSLKVV